MSKPLWSMSIGDLNFDGPRLPSSQFLWGFGSGVLVTVLAVWLWLA